MKYERMKKSNVHCNVIADTDRNFVKKLSDDIQLARKTLNDAAFKAKQKFPALLREVSQQVDDPGVENKFKSAFVVSQIEMKKAISYIDSAAKQLNKGTLTACVKFLKLARWSMLQANDDIVKLEKYYSPSVDEVVVTAKRIVGLVALVADTLEDDIRKIGSIIV